MMNPFKTGFYGVQLISHKLLRYMVPYFLVVLFLSSAILTFVSTFFLLLFVLQFTFYFVGALSYLLHLRNWRLGVLGFPFYFMLSNVAAGAGLLNFLRGNRFARWEPAR